MPQIVTLPSVPNTVGREFASALLGGVTDLADKRRFDAREERLRQERLADVSDARRYAKLLTDDERKYLETTKTSDREALKTMKEEDTRRAFLVLLRDNGYLNPEDMGKPEAVAKAFDDARRDGNLKKWADAWKAGHLKPEDVNDPKKVEVALAKMGAKALSLAEEEEVNNRKGLKDLRAAATKNALLMDKAHADIQKIEEEYAKPVEEPTAGAVMAEARRIWATDPKNAGKKPPTEETKLPMADALEALRTKARQEDYARKLGLEGKLKGTMDRLQSLDANNRALLAKGIAADPDAVGTLTETASAAPPPPPPPPLRRVDPATATAAAKVAAGAKTSPLNDSGLIPRDPSTDSLLNTEGVTAETTAVPRPPRAPGVGPLQELVMDTVPNAAKTIATSMKALTPDAAYRGVAGLVKGAWTGDATEPTGGPMQWVSDKLGQLGPMLTRVDAARTDALTRMRRPASPLVGPPASGPGIGPVGPLVGPPASGIGIGPGSGLGPVNPLVGPPASGPGIGPVAPNDPPPRLTAPLELVEPSPFSVTPVSPEADAAERLFEAKMLAEEHTSPIAAKIAADIRRRRAARDQEATMRAKMLSQPVSTPQSHVPPAALQRNALIEPAFAN